MKRFLNIRGFTLVEVLLSIAIAGGVAVAVFSAFQLINSIRIRQQNAGRVTWEGDAVLQRLRVQIGRGVSAPAPQQTADTLTMTDGSVVAQRDGVLVLTSSGQEFLLSSPDVRLSSLSFSDRGTAEVPGIIAVDFTLSTTASDSRTAYEHQYTTSIYGR